VGPERIATNGGIIVSVSYGILMALAPDGSVRWIHPVERLYTSEPLVAGDGTIYLGKGSTLRAVAPTDGSYGRCNWAARSTSVAATDTFTRSASSPYRPPL
jgi:outer membrane protein assembly factor BamB